MAKPFRPALRPSALALTLLLSAPAALANPSDVWHTLSFEAHNPLAQARNQALVCIDLKQIEGLDASKALPNIKAGQQWLKVGLFDCDGDQLSDSLAVHLDFAAKETQQLTVYWPSNGRAQAAANTPRKTQAELAMRVDGVANAEGQLQGGHYLALDALTLPSQHTIGDKLFKYEGLGWESSKVAYRWYFDNRSAIDIFGKQTPELVLDQIGQDHTDYHSLSHWGMDVLKVGPSLGLGGVASWSAQAGVNGVNRFGQAQAQILSAGDAAGVKLDYQHWQTQDGAVNLSAELWIQPNSTLTRVSSKSSADLSHWATGIVRHGLNTLSAKNTKGLWRYMATWGKQSLADDNLGMAIFYRAADLKKLTEDDYNHLAIFNGGATSLYYLAAYWRQSGIDSEANFQAELEAALARLNNPIAVKKLPAQSSTQPAKKP
ncbi:DUF4861 family protein [Simiduia curdlanivorans]|uniref:DUF4861 family protein n=1 Tax=Simiduia curdlanivorans TaxID=1492769 RepID=A0ABV8V3N1_9GAMM|nr:DUF4861 family protein [Simiduia curdlanivorans]MDN3637507.1 DUF4861 family protein [Simiduia curdlanivorans]